MNMNQKFDELTTAINSLREEKRVFVNAIETKTAKLMAKRIDLGNKIREIQRPKFKTDIKYATFVWVLMKDGSKQVTNNYMDLNIERELTADEYLDYAAELGFIVGANVSQWDNSPKILRKIDKGFGGYVQPSLWISDHPVKLYNFKLVVDTPTKFWHYKFKL